MSTNWSYSFNHWRDLLAWVTHHEGLFKTRFKRSTAKDFAFSKSKWDQFYKLTRRATVPFELKVYTKVRVGQGNVNFIPKEVRFITVIVRAQVPPKEYALYNKRAWKQYVRSPTYNMDQNAQEYKEITQQIVDDEWDINDENL